MLSLRRFVVVALVGLLCVVPSTVTSVAAVRPVPAASDRLVSRRLLSLLSSDALSTFLLHHPDIAELGYEVFAAAKATRDEAEADTVDEDHLQTSDENQANEVEEETETASANEVDQTDIWPFSKQAAPDRSYAGVDWNSVLSNLAHLKPHVTRADLATPKDTLYREIVYAERIVKDIMNHPQWSGARIRQEVQNNKALAYVVAKQKSN